MWDKHCAAGDHFSAVITNKYRWRTERENASRSSPCGSRTRKGRFRCRWPLWGALCRPVRGSRRVSDRNPQVETWGYGLSSLWDLETFAMP